MIMSVLITTQFNFTQQSQNRQSSNALIYKKTLLLPKK